ncbi:hypothetical protein PC9H_001529 [Pleurotus ostreatus]|uniref:Cytochrome P450 n=1 Tax=Pleurotus ostreatus TaxID=5322 RepID=A0A8H7AAM0_PLEOS|nr:uncharacterized protein PC9H_001529 [Pleurotus ostreatus]KAF7441180.1 hypothetical protein PC9H_001529 [Pleurotus ostreatus]
MAFSVNTVALLALVFLLSAYLKRRTTKRPPLPPGPPADPFIGHLRIMPSDQQELVFHEWAKTYGDVMHLKVFGHDIIVLDSVQAATELLEKRSALYSDRPNFTVYTTMGWDHNVAFFPYGRRFRKHRKLLQSYLSQQFTVKFRPIQEFNARYLAKGLVENTRDFKYYISRYTISVIMRIAYGHQILSDDDEYMPLVENVAYAQNNGGPPGGTIAEGTAERSFLRTQMESMSGKDLTDEDIQDLKGSAGVLFAAGFDTTSSSLETFVLALLHHPDVQKRGQEEFDRVIGDRLPTFEDYDALPYAGRVTMEVLRWHPSAPLGVPHRAMEDDIYRGMFIPKGAIIIPNAKGMNLDGNVYTKPTEFNPDRFLRKSEGGNEEPPPVATFGFGRRICPGRHLAATNLWIAVATIFATVNITKAKDEGGNEITPEIIFESGVTSRPKAFSCNIVPRSEKMIRIVASESKNPSM